MPIYVAHCNKCEYMTDFTAKIDDRDRMNDTPCPLCDGTMSRIITTVAFGDPVRLGMSGKDGGMKEVLQKIHATTPGSRLDKVSTINKI